MMFPSTLDHTMGRYRSKVMISAQVPVWLPAIENCITFFKLTRFDKERRVLDYVTHHATLDRPESSVGEQLDLRKMYSDS